MFNRPWYPRVFKAVINSKGLIKFPLSFFVTQQDWKYFLQVHAIQQNVIWKSLKYFMGLLNLNIYIDPIHFPLTKFSCRQRVLSWMIRMSVKKPTVRGTAMSRAFEGRACEVRENQGCRRLLICIRATSPVPRGPEPITPWTWDKAPLSHEIRNRSDLTVSAHT